MGVHERQCVVTVCCYLTHRVRGVWLKNIQLIILFAYDTHKTIKYPSIWPVLSTVPFNTLSSTSGIKWVNSLYSWMGFAAVQNITAQLYARDLFYAHVNEALTAVSVIGDFSLKHSGIFFLFFLPKGLSVRALLHAGLKQTISSLDCSV